MIAATNTIPGWAFPIFFAGMWVFVGFFISQSGWRGFAERYAAGDRPDGTAYTAPRAWFGSIFASYNNVARVIFTDRGIYVYAMFLFRAFHPPFLLPWESVKKVEKKKGFFTDSYRMDIEDTPGELHLLLPENVENDLFKYYQPH